MVDRIYDSNLHTSTCTCCCCCCCCPLLGRLLRTKCTETHLNYLIGRLSRFLFLGGRHVGVCDPALTNMPAVRQIGQAMSVSIPERLIIKFRQTRQTKGAPWEQLLNLNTASETRQTQHSSKSSCACGWVEFGAGSGGGGYLTPWSFKCFKNLVSTNFGLSPTANRLTRLG